MPRTTAFDKDLMENLPHMRAFARSLTQDQDKAKDLVQDAVVRILRAQHQYQPGTNFKAWAFTVLRNLHISSFRNRFCDTLDLDNPTVITCSVPANQHVVFEFHELQRALLNLSPEQREVLVLVGARGYSYEEAAQICGCAIGTIKSRMSRGRDAIFQSLGGLPGDHKEESKLDSSRRPSLTEVWPRGGIISTTGADEPSAANALATAATSAVYVSA